MTAVLIFEIVFALLAFAIMAGMAISFFIDVVRKKPLTSKKRHTVLSVALISAACIHGIAATVYASGAHGATYAFGWAAVALLCAAGATMVAPRANRKKSKTTHIVLFFASIACVIAHILIARM